jgi:hypothetical protein
MSADFAEGDDRVWSRDRLEESSVRLSWHFDDTSEPSIDI